MSLLAKTQEKKKSVENRFDTESLVWEKSYAKASYNIISLELVERYEYLKSFLHENHQDQELNILDVGCGTGNVLQQLLESNLKWRGTGIDLSQGMVDICTNKKIDRAAFQKADLEKDPNHFEESSFDVIYLMGVVGYIQDLPLFFNHLSNFYYMTI